MSVFLILLRGVMPVGKNKVPMAQLRVVLTEAGFASVRTYIASGNVILRSELGRDEVEERVHALIKRHIGPDLVVIARTADELRHILTSNPFDDYDTTHMYYTVLSEPADPELISQLLPETYAPERFVVTDEALYLLVAERYSLTKLHNNFVEKKLRISATTRNYNTMTKLLTLAADL